MKSFESILRRRRFLSFDSKISDWFSLLYATGENFAIGIYPGKWRQQLFWQISASGAFWNEENQ
jgi:hypothetical protein